jgi:CBS domain containing-hemolysin-like protein
MDSSSIWVQVLELVGLLCLSAFFSSAETALVACNKIRIRTLAEEGNKRAKVLMKVFSQESKMLSAILIGNNLVNTLMASIASLIAYNFGGYAVSIATFLITFLILVFGEITPKTLATQHSQNVSLAYANIIYLLMKLLTPIIWFINLFSKMVLKLLGDKSGSTSSAMAANEIRTIVDLSHEEGMIEEDEKEMINNVFDFGEAKAKDVMVPRVHVVMAENTSSYKDLVHLFQQEQFTRIPIYEENIDNVIGFINMKDFLLLEDPAHFDLKKILRLPFFTVENKNISDLLTEMKRTMIHMAIVLDEYGEVAGIVTMEDILEEIVGSVHDEYDEHEIDNIKKVDENTYIVKGYVSIHDVNDALDLDLKNKDFDSVGGLIIDALGRLPKISDQIMLENGIHLQVVMLDGNRIEDVKLTLPSEKEDEKEAV